MLFLLVVFIISSCTTEEKYNGSCKYVVKNNIFSSEKEIEIVSDYSKLDAYEIILSEIIDSKSKKQLVIKLSSTNVKYIKKEDVKYIHENGNKLSYYDNIFVIIRKCGIVADRLNQKE